MVKIYCSVYNKYRKSKNTKTSYTFKKKKLVLSIVYSKRGYE